MGMDICVNICEYNIISYHTHIHIHIYIQYIIIHIHIHIHIQYTYTYTYTYIHISLYIYDTIWYNIIYIYIYTHIPIASRFYTSHVFPNDMPIFLLNLPWYLEIEKPPGHRFSALLRPLLLTWGLAVKFTLW